MDSMNKDEEQLRLLVIFHYVLAGLAALFACFPIIHLAMGLLMLTAPQSFHDGHGTGPPAFMGWMFVIMGGTFIVLGWIYAVCVFIAGRRLARRKSYTFCLVMAGVECIFMPFGTVLGVFTIIVLMRDSVKTLFEVQSVPQAK
jgi:hypothetical protein